MATAAVELLRPAGGTPVHARSKAATQAPYVPALSLEDLDTLVHDLDAAVDLAAGLDASLPLLTERTGAAAAVACAAAGMALRVLGEGLDGPDLAALHDLPAGPAGHWNEAALACASSIISTAAAGAGYPQTQSHALRGRDGVIVGLLSLAFDATSPDAAARPRLSALVLRELASFVERMRQAAPRHAALPPALVENTPAGILDICPEGRIRHGNRAACELFGYPLEELRGRHIAELTPAESLDATARIFGQLHAGEASARFEKRCLRRDGGTFQSSCNVNAQRDPDGRLLGLTAVIVDLAEHRRAESLQGGLRCVLEKLACGEPTADTLAELVTVVERVSSIGARGAMLLFREPGPRLHVAAAPSLPTGLVDAIEDLPCPAVLGARPADVEGTATAAVLELLQPLASVHGLHPCVAEPVVARDGTVLGLFILYHAAARSVDAADLELVQIAARTASLAVERAQSEQALRESEQRFRTMADHAPVMIWVSDDAGRCSFLSQTWYDYTGHAAPAGLGDAWLDAVHEDDRPRVRATVDSLRERRAAVRCEYRLRRADGSYRWMLDAMAPRFDGDGRVLGCIGSVLDIDDHWRRERNGRFTAHLQTALARLDDDGEILQVAADRICRYLGLSALQFADVDDARDAPFIVHAHAAGGDDPPPLTPDALVDPASLDSMRNGRLIAVEDVERDTRTAASAGPLLAYGTRALQIVPHPIRGHWRFVLVAHDRQARAWREDERELLQEVAGRVHVRLERARANHTLRRSREQYRALFDSIDEGFCVIEVLHDAQGVADDYRFLEINPAFERHTGLRAALGRTMRELVPQFEDYWFRTYGEVAHSGRPVRFEAQARALQRWFDVYAFRVGGADERRVAVLFSDITGRKHTEDALRRNEERLRLALVTGRLGSWQLDLLTMELTCTALCKSHYGLAADESLSYARLWGELVHIEDRERLQRALRSAVEEHRDYEAEYRVVWADGSLHWIVSRGRPGYDATGRAVSIAGVTLDVTERRQTEDALRDADRRKDEFIAMLAHELRNPLAPLRHCLHILQMDGIAPGDAARLHGMMDRQLRHLVRLVDDLLEVSRISRGKIELRPEAVELAQVLEHAADTSRPLIDAGRHEFEVALPLLPLRVYADPMRLAQVFSNLLNNAAKYTPHGGRITVNVHAEESEAVIRIRDTGMGIPADMLTRVFDMFSQVETSRGQAQGGLGIGLTLVRNLVELHGGSVDAYSDGLGRGSEFVVRLPLDHDAPVEAPGAALPAPADETARRVLVVDDNRESADSLAMFLRLCEREVFAVYDGEAAIEAAARLRPDVMLVDIGLPGRNGFDVCAHIRAQDWGADIAIFAVTGWGQQNDRERSERCGFDAHLVKPVDPDALVARIDEVFRERSGRTGS